MWLPSIFLVALFIAKIESFPTFYQPFPYELTGGFLPNFRPFMTPWNPFFPPLFEPAFSPHFTIPNMRRFFLTVSKDNINNGGNILLGGDITPKESDIVKETTTSSGKVVRTETNEISKNINSTPIPENCKSENLDETPCHVEEKVIPLTESQSLHSTTETQFLESPTTAKPLVSLEQTTESHSDGESSEAVNMSGMDEPSEATTTSCCPSSSDVTTNLVENLHNDDIHTTDLPQSTPTNEDVQLPTSVETKEVSPSLDTTYSPQSTESTDAVSISDFTQTTFSPVETSTTPQPTEMPTSENIDESVKDATVGNSDESDNDNENPKPESSEDDTEEELEPLLEEILSLEKSMALIKQELENDMKSLNKGPDNIVTNQIEAPAVKGESKHSKLTTIKKPDSHKTAHEENEIIDESSGNSIVKGKKE